MRNAESVTPQSGEPGMRPAASGMKRAEIGGLNTLRFMAASFVVLSHGGAFPFAAYFPAHAGLSRILLGIYACAFNGPAAVLVFFLISGFCIHYSFACGMPFRMLPFLTRRMVRISIPVVAALAGAAMLGPWAKGGLYLVLWSLYCEMCYYVAYPLMRLAFQRTGLLVFTLATLLLSLVLIGLNWHVTYFQDLPIILTSLIMLPAWLGGCILAEMVAKGSDLRLPGNVVWWRLALWGYATGAELYFFHGGLKMGWPAVLTPFYVFAFFWLTKEIQNFRERGTSAFLEWCGKWSYSLYLIHNIVIYELLDFPGSQTLTWAVRVVAIVVSSLAFYGLVEYPAHQLARIAARRVATYLPFGSWKRYAKP